MVGSGIALSIALAGPAAAGECPPAGHAGVVECPTTPVEPVDAVDVSTVEVDAPRGGGLPVTGGDVVGLVVIGGVALGTGVVLVTGARRRRADV